ncbi:MAG: helix-hairpin-helix domain-containing protein [Prevotella sp.]|jgi:DNA uptake protein ComE-like DNA-binding protein|nr:helix-hairpin-helix domain-containing protein [Prevotella sp.]
MNWKDCFYFQKRDRTAIILLLVLIVLAGGIYIFTRPQPRTNDGDMVSLEVSGADADFDTDNMPVDGMDNMDNTTIDDIKPVRAKPSAYPRQEKLKAGETIELNSADTSSLKKIPGIGTGFANRIVKYGNLLGGYADIAQLKEVWGLDDELYNKVVPYITLDPRVRKTRINSADFKELNKHPYIDFKQARAIVDIRERKGNIESLKRLSLLEEFTEDDIKRLAPYLSCD